MDCPRCKHVDNSVIDSRDAESDTIRRRRQCDQCRFRFTTYERIEPVKLTVQKRDSSLETYQRDKILQGLKRAVEKRGIDQTMLDSMVDRIETKIMMCCEDQLTSQQIGEYVMQELAQVDAIAYLRFASVYRSFDSLEAFHEELVALAKNPQTGAKSKSILNDL